VFQRTPNFAAPLGNRPLTEEESRHQAENHEQVRAGSRENFLGAPYEPAQPSALAVSPEERRRVYDKYWNGGGFRLVGSTFQDLLFDKAANDTIADYIRDRIREQVRDPATAEALCPTDHPYATKRAPFETGYYEAFNRDDVDLVDLRRTPIQTFTPEGIRTQDGTLHEFDVLVLATGFWLATDPEPYTERPVRGRDGFDLAEFYAAHRARSYESVSMPGLPNHFMIFGPYGWTGGTWHVLVETASAHIVRVLQEAQRRGACSVEVREHAADRWTAFAVDRLGRSLWHDGMCQTANSYYFDRHGDTPFLRPTSSTQAHRAARTFPLDDYAFATAGATPG